MHLFPPFRQEAITMQASNASLEYMSILTSEGLVYLYTLTLEQYKLNFVRFKMRKSFVIE